MVDTKPILKRLHNGEIDDETAERLINEAFAEEEKEKVRQKRGTSVKDLKDYVEDALREQSVDAIMALFKVFIETYPYEIEYDKLEPLKQRLEDLWKSNQHSEIMKILGTLSKREQFPNPDNPSKTKTLTLFPPQKQSKRNLAHEPYIKELNIKAGLVEPDEEDFTPDDFEDSSTSEGSEESDVVEFDDEDLDVTD